MAAPEIVKQEKSPTGGDKPSYSYPTNIDDSPVYFTINMREFKSSFSDIGNRGTQPGIVAPTLDNPSSAITGTIVNNISVDGFSVHLPMPVSGLEDSFRLNYDPVKMGAIGGVGSTISNLISGKQGIVGAIGSGIGGILQGLGESVGAALGDVVGEGQAGEAAAQLMMGSISNPNLALLFKGVNLRKHSFRWKMIARNSDESDQISNIITLLKKRALPERQLGGNFVLKYPYVAYLGVNGPKEGHLLTFSDKGCFIENITVSYQGQAHPSFFKDSKSPVEVDLQIDFFERAIIASQDVKG